MAALRTLAGKALALVLAWTLILSPQFAYAGDLNSEVNDMFTSLGTIGNYTAPGAFKGQTFNTYTGGSLYMRAPNKTYQLLTMDFPTAKAGCGGIDVFAGSFGHISSTELKNMLKNITAALPGIAFQLALEAVSPLLGGTTKWAESLKTFVNNARINSCEAAKSLVSTAAEATGFATSDACIKIAMELGLEADNESARKRCQTDRASILASGRASSSPDIKAMAPFVGNLTWQALKRVDSLDDKSREIVMSILGTHIYFPEEAHRTPRSIPPTLQTVSDLLYGVGDASTSGSIKVLLLKCNNYTECDDVTSPGDYVHQPLNKKVEDLMHSISDKIASRTPIPNDSAEIGFVNRTSEPVWRMLSVGNTIPGSGLAESMIQSYRDIIAADYAHSFLSLYLKLGSHSLTANWTLDKRQQEDAKELIDRAAQMMALLSQEKATLYTQKTAVTSAAMYLEQLERQLRSSMPHHVMDMLGQSAALTR